jgi:murein endopeptidase
VLFVRIPFLIALACGLLSIESSVFAGTASRSLAAASASAPLPNFAPCDPVSDLLAPDEGAPDVAFCSDWNPDFSTNGYRCCSKPVVRRRGRRRRIALPSRHKKSYCDEMTPEQREYIDSVQSAKHADPLVLISDELGKRREQAYCDVNTGFLAWGRPIVPSSLNRIRLRSPDRCTEFGTDAMAGMLEWAGRQVAKQYPAPEYSGTHLLVGDISAPRGGHLGHRSHKTGLDADIGFLHARKGAFSPGSFDRDFVPEANWWLIKQLFKNPYACVKVMFLDRRLIRKLDKTARNDGDWLSLRRFVRHMPGHRNHIHVRVGPAPGAPGCTPNAHPELEQGEEGDGENADLSEPQLAGVAAE